MKHKSRINGVTPLIISLIIFFSLIISSTTLFASVPYPYQNLENPENSDNTTLINCTDPSNSNKPKLSPEEAIRNLENIEGGSDVVNFINVDLKKPENANQKLFFYTIRRFFSGISESLSAITDGTVQAPASKGETCVNGALSLVQSIPGVGLARTAVTGISNVICAYRRSKVEILLSNTGDVETLANILAYKLAKKYNNELVVTGRSESDQKYIYEQAKKSVRLMFESIHSNKVFDDPNYIYNYENVSTEFVKSAGDRFKEARKKLKKQILAKDARAFFTLFKATPEQLAKLKKQEIEEEKREKARKEEEAKEIEKIAKKVLPLFKDITKATQVKSSIISLLMERGYDPAYYLKDLDQLSTDVHLSVIDSITKADQTGFNYSDIAKLTLPQQAQIMDYLMKNGYSATEYLPTVALLTNDAQVEAIKSISQTKARFPIKSLVNISNPIQAKIIKMLMEREYHPGYIKGVEQLSTQVHLSVIDSISKKYKDLDYSSIAKLTLPQQAQIVDYLMKEDLPTNLYLPELSLLTNNFQVEAIKIIGQTRATFSIKHLVNISNPIQVKIIKMLMERGYDPAHLKDIDKLSSDVHLRVMDSITKTGQTKINPNDIANLFLPQQAQIVDYLMKNGYPVEYLHNVALLTNDVQVKAVADIVKTKKDFYFAHLLKLGKN